MAKEKGKKGKSQKEQLNEEVEPIEKKNGTKEDDIITNDKIRIQDFIQKERISPWAARVFMKNLNRNEYTETELKKLYKEFVDEGKKDNKKGVKK